mmetsp:Transcript_35187/g.111202  ORF Transcript_35187/g.111202 Transcript_35187/m.111202 type:complete len:220 (+) Transcript_35187:121-780(+)
MKRRRRRAALLTPNNVALVGLCLSTLWLLSRIISERRHSRAISLPVEDSDEEPGDDEPSEEAEAQVWNGKVGLKVRKRKLDDNNKRRPQKYKVLDERRIRHNANIPLPPLEGTWFAAMTSGWLFRMKSSARRRSPHLCGEQNQAFGDICPPGQLCQAAIPVRAGAGEEGVLEELGSVPARQLQSLHVQLHQLRRSREFRQPSQRDVWFRHRHIRHCPAH